MNEPVPAIWTIALQRNLAVERGRDADAAVVADHGGLQQGFNTSCVRDHPPDAPALIR
jgi:hypothetical protein